MSYGNLPKKVVSQDFWPHCNNCALHAECEKSPRHPAFPHQWHWSHETANFGEDMLVLKSWVGTAAYGQEHTGCYSYAVDEQFVKSLQDDHKHYLELWQESLSLDAELNRLERLGVYNDKVSKKYERLYTLWNEMAETN